MMTNISSPEMVKVESKLKYWSQQLHDLSGRNRLLFYRDTKSSTAAIEAPEFRKLFEMLVEKGSELSVPLPAAGEDLFLTDDESGPEAVEKEWLDEENLIYQEELEVVGPAQEKPDEQEVVPEKPVSKRKQKPKENEILTNHSTPNLNRVMYNLRYAGRTVQEEQGFNILYITFGMLKWKDTQNGEFSRAPLILVPIQIERENALSPYKIKMAEEDILVNPVLQTKLAKDFAFQFPEVTNEISTAQLVEFLSFAREQIQRFEGWEILEQAAIGAFNFMTQALIKDFENYAPLYRQHPFVQILSGVDSVTIPEPDKVPQARELDDLVDPSTVYQILDADSSQQEAIEAAKEGLSFVLQGPPGTGKSQTIANIIVESMMAGKKVLFVSQKMAALEVVQNRLSRKGLREFCLEVHSHKMDKRKVVRELMASLANTSLIIKRADDQMRRQELKHVRDELNSYVRQLHEPRLTIGQSLYQAQGGLAQCLDAPQLNFSIPHLETMSAADFGKMLSPVREIAGYPVIIEAYPVDRWRGYKGLENSLEERESLSARFDAVVEAIEKSHRDMCEITDRYKLPAPETIQDDLDYLFIFENFQPSIFSLALQKTIRRYVDQYQSVSRYFSAQYWKDVSELKNLSRRMMRPQTMWQALEFVKKITDKRDALILDSSVDYDQPLGDLSSLATDKAQIMDGFETALNLFDENDLPETLKKKYDQSPAEAADWFADHALHTEELAEWANFNTVRKQCNENGLQDFVSKALENQLPPEKWEAAFARRFYVLLIERLTADRPLLQKFKGTMQTELIRRFRELDLAMIEDSSHEIRAKLFAQKPQLAGIEAGSSEASILRREYNKKRRLMPLRKLFLGIPNLIQALKPCLMMSPLTVCQLLDPSTYRFDLVVFDEASQVPPEYAMSGLLRAKQMIVAGDSQQLPPTNFFHTIESGRYTDEEDYEDASYESILHACDTCGFPNKMLNWHYRSRDESLIAYSNYHFYENRLYTFPNSSLNSPDTGLKFVYVKDGIYKGGDNARYNLKEARRVAELVHDHLVNHPDLSLGIVAFSVPQRRAIEAEIEKLRAENPDLDSQFSYDADEPIFIKNLENVQGDERDVIILSVGYGKDEKGRMNLNFGPINREGGARRLNVAVTRARYLLRLVASIQPEDIDLTRANSRGAGLLRNYLEAARDGVEAVFQSRKREADAAFGSLFEESVYNELTRRGLQLARQVGVSQYRIDLAVMDPQEPSHFLLGIECDGPMYYSALTARDRDRLRQQVLEGLGWKVHRIWSRDWIQNREREIEKIMNAIRAQQDGVPLTEPRVKIMSV